MTHTKESMRQFAQELAALLEKHDVVIEWECGEGFDTHGLYDERMVISPRLWENSGLSVSVEGSSIDANSLKTIRR